MPTIVWAEKPIQPKNNVSIFLQKKAKKTLRPNNKKLRIIIKNEIIQYGR